MQFSDVGNDKHGKAGKFTLIAALHVAVGMLFVHSLNTRHLSLSILPDTVLVMMKPDLPTPPPPPPEPPMPTQQLTPPPLPYVPPPQVDVAPPQDPAPIAATSTPDPRPADAAPATTATTNPGPSTTAPAHDANPGQMHTAVLADARSCALPAYPAKAARDGDAGTVLLALLVGVDGRVTSARVQHTSGSRELDKAALQALSLCKFKPATNNGVPEAGWAQLAYVWTLD